MKNVVIIGGNGKWGQNYVKTLATFPDVSLEVATRDNWKCLVDEEPDAVIVSTPPSSHVEIASYALAKGIPTMIEKPLALSLQDAERLKQFDARVLVNHIHLFAEQYEKIKSGIDTSKINSINTYGLGKGPFRDYSALWDYGAHCLSLILDLAEQMPYEIVANRRDDGNYDIEMIFGKFTTQSIVGNKFVLPYRELWVNFDGIWSGYTDGQRPDTHKPPLQRALEVFLNHPEDRRFGLDLSLNVIKLLECCQQSVDTCTTVIVK